MSKTEKKQLSTKYKFVYFFSFVANVMIAVGIIIDGISKGRGVPGTLGMGAVLIIIAIVWSKTAGFGEKVFRFFTPQRDYLTRSKLSLVLSEWVLTFLISVGGFILLLTPICTFLFGMTADEFWTAVNYWLITYL